MSYSQMFSCNICPRNCGIDRTKNKGYCGVTDKLRINLATRHFGEEPCFSGTRGSGTIFFAGCNLRCVYCQNYEISTLCWGKDISVEELIRLMLKLQEEGAHNINLVTPTHFTLQLREAIIQAKEKGLTIPVLWNSSAYEKVETLQLLTGLVDIYLPDFKYAHKVYAQKYSAAPDYPAVAISAIKEMFSQVGLLKLDEKGIAQKGLLLRMLILPNKLAGCKENLYTLAEELGTELTLSLMGQYYPAGKAKNYKELTRGITLTEYFEVVDTAVELGFTKLYTQEISSSDTWTPNFSPAPEEINPASEFNPQLELTL
ncbi:radical SAM protein [Candidatus Cloacimonas acidaminovorans]|uniref:Enzyme with radical SAM domain protein (Fe-S protein) n=1 Tax=Cloacimonas acidaminovorans (strain Evry) TaxID=459349 RepID=B0VFM7_CLOAI|nr:radical SAM protein [Candidatus Cloacimonas acidaminovorans]CAO81365.1 putative enzyme with radical SAM domain protein (Fe-S protein) [Candidatus Cloacimonas acidaminovorans str. Evry]